MKRTLVKQTPKLIGKKLRVAGWINTVRKHGQLNFADLRDRSGLLQLVGGKSLSSLKPEFVVEIVGSVKKRDKKYFNPKLLTGTIELQVEKIKILAKSQDLPFDISKPDLNVSLPILLDHRAASLRNKKIKDIFKVQATIVQAFRSHLKKNDFTEFQAPTVVATATEGGSQVFPVNYFGYKAYLAQSPQFYKQIMVSIFERVFTVAHAYRAEPSVTTRHLTEYVGLDVELGFIDSWLDVIKVADDLVKAIFKAVKDNHADILKEYSATIPKTTKTTPIIKLSEAQDIIFQGTKRDIRGQPDLDPEGERQICGWALEEKDSELVFITHYPTKKRPWYTYQDPKNPKETLGFDLIGRGVEWITGGQRIHDYDFLTKNIKKMGANPQDFEIPYLQAFRYGMPPEGGFCLGLERITQNILGLDNIRKATLYPRDMERVDARLSVIGRKFSSSSDKTFHQRLIAFLKQNKINYKQIQHQPVFTCKQAAKIRGCTLKQGAKALLMIADKDPILVVISGAKKLDTATFKKQFKVKNLKMATAKQVKKITGVSIGAVHPFGNLFNVPVYADKHFLADHVTIAFNPGSHSHSVILKSADFAKLVKPKKASFSK